MHKKKMLPFVLSPYSLMYHYTAFPLGIVQANMESRVLESWLGTKYIDCSFDELSLSNKFNIGSDLWFTGERILLRHNNVFSRIIYDHYNIDIIELIKKMVDKGYYPQGNYNEEWIPGKPAYEKYHFFHDYIIIGYDDFKMVFYSVGFLKNERFEMFEINYNNMKKALETLFDSHIGIDFLEYNVKKVANLNVDVKEISKKITNYLNNDGLYKKENANISFGLAAIKRLSEFIKIEAEDNDIDIKYIIGFVEHKYFMNMRINYLLTNGYIVNNNCLVKSKEVLKIAENIKFMALKFYFNHKKELIHKIVESMEKTIKMELDYLSLVTKELDYYSKN